MNKKETITLRNIEGIALKTGTDLHGCQWTEFTVDHFAEQEAGECAICGASLESGWLCLDGGEEVCSTHVETLLSDEEHKETRARIDAFEQWRNGRTSYRTEDVPADVPQVSNEERSSVERYEFCLNPPDRYFVYIKTRRRADTNAEDLRFQGAATTWTGDYLGSVTFGYAFRSGFGDTRVPVTIHAINGRVYHGTYYKSAGDYARVKQAKSKKH